MRLLRFASLILLVIATSLAEVTTESGLDLGDTSKEELQRSDAGMKRLMDAILGDADLHDDDSVDDEDEFVELPDTNKAEGTIDVRNTSYTSKLKIVKRNRTRNRSNLTCSKEEYMEQLRSIIEENYIKPPVTDDVGVKRAIKKMKNVLEYYNISTLPSCKWSRNTRNDNSTTAQTPLPDKCTSRTSYFVSLVLYASIWKKKANLSPSEVSKIRQAYDNRTVASFYEFLYKAATAEGFPPPEKCEEYSSDPVIPPKFNCTLLINFNEPGSFDAVMKKLEELKGENKQLSSPEDVHDLNKQNSNLFSTSCSGDRTSKTEPAGPARQSKLPTIILYELHKEDEPYFNDTYFDVLMKTNKSRSEIRESLKTNEVFYLDLLPQVYSDLIKKEQRHVPDWYESLVWDQPFPVYNSSLRTNMTLISDLVGEKAFFFMSLYDDPQKEQMNAAISILILVSLMCGMLSLGCTMTFAEIMKHARQPKGVLIALVSQFVIMPAAALGLVKGFHLEMYAGIAVLICGCCPGGNLSNILAYALNGDMNLSILMTTCSSVLGLGMMPFNIWAYSRFIIPVDAGESIPFTNIIINIALTLVPVFIGLMIRNFRPTWVDYIIKGGFFLMISASVGIGFLAGILFQDAFFRFFPIELVAVCAILPLAGYSLGYFFATVAREKPKCCRTIMVETGCQNVQLCTSVLRMAFDPIAINILFLMPLLYMMFQLFEAFLIILVLRTVTRCSNKGKIIEHKSDDSDSFSKEFSDHESVNNKSRDNKDLLNMVPTGECYGQPNIRPISVVPVDIGEAWPLQGPPTDACINSFDAATTENLV